MKKQYIITDPCYVIDSNTWSNVCKECFDDSSEQYENFNKRITKELNDLAGTTDAIAVETGYGDWSNCMHCSNDAKIIQSDFFADSGMVCVVEYTDSIKQALIDQNNDGLIDDDHGGIALIETEGDVKIEVNRDDPQWTVIEIEDDNDGFNSMLSPFTDEDEDDYEDDYNEDEEEDD